jgi:hypothetical protein
MPLPSSSVTFSPRGFDESDVQNNLANTRKSTASNYSKTSSHNNGIQDFVKEIDRIQAQKMLYALKVENEKKKKITFDENFLNAREVLLELQNKTKNGCIIKEDDRVYTHKINRHEHSIQMAKIKLSVARSDNAVMKQKIDEARKDKIMHMQIIYNLENEFEEAKKRNSNSQRDIIAINDKKHRIKVEITNTKHKMIRDMEDFSRGLSAAKHNIQSTQENIMGSIRSRLVDPSSVLLSATSPGDFMSRLSPIQITEPTEPNERAFLHAALNEIGLESLEELISALQTSEEQNFVIYNDIQIKNNESDKIDLENKYLEIELQNRETQLDSLKGHNEKLKHELENHIAIIKKSIAKYDLDYSANMSVLNTIAESLFNLLKNLAIEEEVLDQQLLSTGITDRNIDDFLGLVEQRIDDLIQMAKAAGRNPIKKDDFLIPITTDKQAIVAPSLPSLHDTNDDDDDDDNNNKVQPINIDMLKVYMNKKIQKGINVSQKQKKEANVLVNNTTVRSPNRNHNHELSGGFSTNTLKSE